MIYERNLLNKYVKFISEFMKGIYEIAYKSRKKFMKGICYGIHKIYEQDYMKFLNKNI